MSDSKKPDQAAKRATPASPPDSDAPRQPSVRECSDRVSAMERELEELRARFAKVTERRSSARV